MASTPAVRGEPPGESAGPYDAAALLAEVDDEPAALSLAGFECSLRTTTLDQLDGIARSLDDRWVRDHFSEFDRTEEVTLFATCCRREVVVLTRTEREVARWRACLPGPRASWVERCGRELVRHLHRVAAGRESVVVGEQEVRLQTRGAGRSTLSRHRSRLLRSMFDDAAEAADRAVPAGPSAGSIAAVAAGRALDLAGRPVPRVLIVGAGLVGRQLAERLSGPADVALVYHRRPPEESFLTSRNVRAVRPAGLRGAIAWADVVVAAAKTGERCIRVEDIPTGRPLALIDLGVPRNVDPEVGQVPGVRLVALDALRAGPTLEPDPALDQALEATADGSYDRLATAALEPWVSAVRRRAEATRAHELAFARRFLGSLSPEQEAAIDRLTRRLVDRLLLGPTERIREIPPGEDGDRLRRFAREMLRPDADGL